MLLGRGVNQVSLNPTELVVTANVRSLQTVVAKNFVGDGSLISNIYFSNVSIPPVLAVDINTGNLTGTSVTLGGNVSASYVLANGSLLTGLVVSNSSLPRTLRADLAGNVVGTSATLGGNVSAFGVYGALFGNLSGANATLSGNASASYVLANGAFLSGLVVSNSSLPGTVKADISGNVVGTSATLSGNVSATGVYGAHVGNLTGVNAALTGNISGNAASFSGNVSAQFFRGNGSLLEGVTATLPTTLAADITGNISGTKATLSGNVSAASVYGALFGNLSGANATLSGNVSATNVYGAHVGNLVGNSVSLIGNISAQFVNATSVIAANAVLASGTTVANTNGTFTSTIFNTGYVYGDTFLIGTASASNGFWRQSDGLLSTSAATISGRLTVNGSAAGLTSTVNLLSKTVGTATWSAYSLSAQALSIVTAWGIYMANGDFWSASDQRKKFDVADEDPAACAEAVRASRLVSYSTKEEPSRKIGFLAQQVANVVPGSVTLAEDGLPTVMRFANVATARSFELDGASESLVGEHVVGVRLMYRDGETLDAEIASVVGDVVTIGGEKALRGRDVFVYGPIVDDFRTLDYQRMWAKAFGAVQHLLSERDSLVRRAEATEAALEELKRRVDELCARQA